jgi:hypothetical protein
MAISHEHQEDYQSAVQWLLDPHTGRKLRIMTLSFFCGKIVFLWIRVFQWFFLLFFCFFLPEVTKRNIRQQRGCPDLGIWVTFLKQPDALPCRAPKIF